MQAKSAASVVAPYKIIKVRKKLLLLILIVMSKAANGNSVQSGMKCAPVLLFQCSLSFIQLSPNLID